VLRQCSPIQWHRGKGHELNAVPEQPVSPDVDAQWLRHLFTWVQQPSHTVFELQLLPSGTIALQSGGGAGDGGGGGGDGGGGSGGGGREQCDGMTP
jgi:uncharacterized membrane protein YgcG